MKELVIAGRYAHALYDVSEDRRLTAEICGELNIVAGNLRDNADFRLLFMSRLLHAAEKKELISAVYGPFFQPLTMNFLHLILDKKREAILPAAISTFNQLFRDSQGIEVATLVSAKPLSLAEETALAASLKQAFNKKNIIFEHKLDPTLLGGALVKIGDLLIDGSLKSRLRQIKEELSKVEIQPNNN